MTRKRGNRFGFWFFQILVRATGLRGAYGFLYIVCLYYVLFDRQAVQSVLPYIKRRFPKAKFLKRYFYVYLLFVNQGKNLIDRFVLMAGYEPFDIKFNGIETLKELLRNENGFILLTSHVGNWQLVMYALETLEKKVYLLMRAEDNQAVRNALKVDQERGNIHIINTDKHLGGVVEMMQALSNGQIVSIMGDRSYQSDQVEVTLFGDKAYLPYSAFRIAAGARCPVAVLSSAKVDSLTYEVKIAKVIEPKMSRRGTMTERWGPFVQEYASSLEEFLDRFPLQYYIFDNIWETTNARDK
ncbi:MAG: lysophospholipid acyltransferase family protein [Sedimentisphaerales bacterium]|nr:lysophospholipid acyltransferase family protein [Sedimentisphaerales bacterium]